MRVVVAGGTGLLGSALIPRLEADGHTVTILSRAPRGPREVAWHPDGTAGEWATALDGADAVINLSGASISEGRWTPDRKAIIDSSRVHPTRSLANAIGQLSRPPAVFISGSAVGYYGPCGDEALTEDSPAGTDFLAGVCNQWEWEAQVASRWTRVVLLRTGLVLHPTGGALPEIVRPFRFYAGGPMGSGQQYWSWIHIEDWVEMVCWALKAEPLDGALNVTAPNPVRNREFAAAVGAVLHRPSWLATPGAALRIALGEMADALLLNGQRVLPARAEWSGYAFRHPDLLPALQALLGRR